MGEPSRVPAPKRPRVKPSPTVPTEAEIALQVTDAEARGAKWADALGVLLGKARELWPAALVDMFSVRSTAPAEWWVGQVEDVSGPVDLVQLVRQMTDKLSKPNARPVKDLRATVRTWLATALRIEGVGEAPAVRKLSASTGGNARVPVAQARRNPRSHWPEKY